MALRHLASALVTAGILVAAAACGSRTGLFTPTDGYEISIDGGGGLPFDAAVGCTPGNFSFQLALTQLMFALDRSGSMQFTLDGAQGAPRSEWRWTILRNSLAQTITTFDNQIAMGAKFFPETLSQTQSTISDVACRLDSTIAIPPAQGNAQRILAGFDQADPVGGTPTSEAINVSAAALNATRSVARTIVLATDGAPNCNGALDKSNCTCTSAAGNQTCDRAVNGQYNCLDDDRTITSIDTVFKQGIPVYVIGIGSLERPDFQAVLDRMAVAGGRPRATSPRYFNVQSADDLTNALTTIRDSVAKCTYLTPSAPTNPDSISVQVSGTVIPRDETHANGWDWIDQRLGELEFFGKACTAAQAATTPTAVGGTIACDP
jgi:hypothetical protein